MRSSCLARSADVAWQAAREQPDEKIIRMAYVSGPTELLHRRPSNSPIAWQSNPTAGCVSSCIPAANWATTARPSRD